MREEAKEKKELRLKFKTLVDGKRWFSKGLHNIIEKFRTKNRDGSDKTLAELYNNREFAGVIKYGVRQTLINISDKQMARKAYTIEDRYDEKREALEIDYEDGELSDKKYQKKLENLEYKKQKQLYANDLEGSPEERPASPRLQRIGRTLKKIVLAPVNAVKYIGRKIQTLGRGTKVALLTTGKVVQKSAVAVKNTVKNQVDPIAQEIKEVEDARKEIKDIDKSKNLTSEEKLQARQDVFYKEGYVRQKQVQDILLHDDWKNAENENARREKEQQKAVREAQRREGLHMNPEPNQIDHEKAQKVEGDILTPEEVKEQYDENELG